MNKLILTGLFSFTSLLVGTQANQVQAQTADLSFSCDPDQTEDCQLQPNNGALFNQTQLMPGDQVSGQVEFINQSESQTCNLEISLEDLSQTPSDFVNKFDSIMMFDSQPVTSGSGNLANLFAATEPIQLGTINPESSLNLDWQLDFATNIGNTYQSAQASFDFNLTASCDSEDEIGNIGNGEDSTNIIQISKTSETTVIQSNTNTTITYTIIVQNTGGNTINNTTVTDLPPEYFQYVSGSWSALSNLRGNLRQNGTTPEPVYSSPGQWQIGVLQPGEVVELSYQAVAQSNVPTGTHPDLAYAFGYDQEENLVMANQADGYFVGSQVIVENSDTFTQASQYQLRSDSSSSSESESGQVLGETSGDILPVTGSPTWVIIFALSLFISGTSLILISKRSNYA